MTQENNNPTSENQGKENGVFHLGYDAKDDIYKKAINEVNIDPENISAYKSENENNEEDYENETMGGDLDVPGSELDDAQEEIGAEDEENNYYSLGLDNHNDLEENKEN